MAQLKSKKRANFLVTRFIRYLSIRAANLFLKSQITPNQLTVGSFIIGIISALCFIKGKLSYDLLGVFLFLIAFFFDFVDGDLARLKNMSSVYGEWLDAVSGKIETVLLYLGICLGQSRHYSPEIVWILGFLGISSFYVNQCLLYKNEILNFKHKRAEAKETAPLVVEPQQVSPLKIIQKEILSGSISIVYLLLFAVIFRNMMVFLWSSAVYLWLYYFLQVYFKGKRTRRVYG